MNKRDDVLGNEYKLLLNLGKAALDERARQDEAEAGDEALWMQDDEPEPDHEP